MKFFLHISASIITFLLLLSTSCNKSAEFRIGVSQCSDDDWRSKMNDEIYREIMFHPEATVEIRSADDNNEKQIADLQYFVDKKFDIIVVSPNEAEAITPIIDQIYDRGIPVVVFDRKTNGDKFTMFQGADNYEMGVQAALYGNVISGKKRPKVLELMGLLGSTPAADRHKGFIHVADSLGFDILASAHANWTYDHAASATDSLLDVYGDVDLIYAHNDRMAIAASDVAKRKGRNVKIIGIDGAPEIGIKAVADSVIDATFIYPTEGYRLVRSTLDILNGNQYERVVKLPIAPVVNRENAGILLMQNDALKEETAKIQLLKTEVDEYWTKHSAQTSLFYAMIVILLLLCGVVFLLLRSFWTNRKHQQTLMEQNHRLEQNRDELANLNERLNEATQSKLTFFTNVSHDLRTPLTLIAEPISELSGADNLTERQGSLVRIAAKNVKILHRLINQILDFRKFENGKLDLALSEVHIAHLLADWTESFQAVARHRELKLSFNIAIDADFTMAIDAEKMERVYFNLLSNAIKYTGPNGKIHIEARIDGDRLQVAVTDTGKGISDIDLDKIFDRFYQAEKVHPKGSGIGLSLAKAFVELHGGELTVESEEGKGSVFTFSLPLRHVEISADNDVQNQITQQDIMDELGIVEKVEHQVDSEKPLLLFIDDNEDMRRLIVEMLADKYSVITAVNGKDGLHLAAKYIPDLIVCDVMMPVMDGLECCRLLKQEVSTSHIPVLLLTACSMDEQRADGYESGADGYLTKPFSAKVLDARCQSLIENRRLIKNVGLNSHVETQSRKTPSSASDLENEFYARVVEIFRQKMSDPELNVDSLASMVGLGRSQFYRKIKAITNYSPVELLRNLRLRQARELLTSTEKTISEIAYETGFSSPAYFTRCYREAYGETPSELRERL